MEFKNHTHNFSPQLGTSLLRLINITLLQIKQNKSSNINKVTGVMEFYTWKKLSSKIISFLIDD